MTNLIKGEKRKIGVVVTSQYPFAIDHATYNVKTSLKKQIGDKGYCIIDGGTAYFLCDTNKGVYKSDRSYLAYISIAIAGGAEFITGIAEITVRSKGD